MGCREVGYREGVQGVGYGMGCREVGYREGVQGVGYGVGVREGWVCGGGAGRLGMWRECKE